MTAEILLSAYVDLNVVLICAAALWAGVNALISLSPLRLAFLTRLKLLYGALVTVALTPVIVTAHAALKETGVIGVKSALSLSDFVVAQYLDGRIDMAPTRFESLLMLRSDLTREVATLATPLGITIAALLAGGLTYAAAQTVRSAHTIAGVIGRSHKLRRQGRVDIRVTSETRVPFSTRGLWRYYIVLPTPLLAYSGDARVAISHELQHIRQGDLTWEIVLEAARPLFFWNPALRYWKRQVEQLRELACDQQVLRRNTFNIRDYCDCLLRVCGSSLRSNDRSSLMVPSVPFAQLDARRKGSTSANFLRFRVMSMLTPANKAQGRAVRVMVMAPIIWVITLAILAAQPTHDWSQDRLMLSTIVNLERLDIRNGVSG